MSIIPPSNTLKSFSCPHCKAIAHQTWFKVGVQRFEKDTTPKPFKEDLKERLDSDDAAEFTDEMKKEFLRRFEGQLSKKVFANAEYSYSRY